MSWVESVSPSFLARHEEEDATEVAAALERLEATRARLAELFPRAPDDITVVFHAHALQLDLAHPLLPLVRRLDAPAQRRYRVGVAGSERIDVLAPRVLRARASSVPGSRELLLHALDALYTRLVVCACNPGLPPPSTPARLLALHRSAWLAQGAGAFFGGQVEHARPAIGRRLHEGSPPSFPPDRADAALLGGTVFDLLAREEGMRAAVALACRPPGGGAGEALTGAFRGRSVRHTEGAWRAHLARLAGPEALRATRPGPPIR